MRPNEPSDIGPLHADRWFGINKAWGNIYPNNFKRTKVWIPIESERQKWIKNFRYSHQDVCRYTYKVHCHKYKNKPVINLPPNDDELELIDIEPGSLLIFDDNLIHGGALNKGCYPRISLNYLYPVLNMIKYKQFKFTDGQLKKLATLFLRIAKEKYHINDIDLDLSDIHHYIHRIISIVLGWNAFCGK